MDYAALRGGASDAARAWTGDGAAIDARDAPPATGGGPGIEARAASKLPLSLAASLSKRSETSVFGEDELRTALIDIGV